MPITVYKSSRIISQPRLAKTQWEKARGLMFSKFHDVLFHFPKEERLKFHMVFVFYPIDIIFMDDDMCIVDFKERFKPFSFYYSKARSSTVLETYSGFIKEHDIRIGDQLTITHDGEIDMNHKRHIPQTSMLHTTSLGTARSAKTAPVGAQKTRKASGATKKRSSPATSTRSTKKAAPSKTKRAAPKSQGSKSAGKTRKTGSSKDTKKSTRSTKKSTKRTAAPTSAKTKRAAPKKSSAKSAARTTRKQSSKSAGTSAKGSTGTKRKR